MEVINLNALYTSPSGSNISGAGRQLILHTAVELMLLNFSNGGESNTVTTPFTPGEAATLSLVGENIGTFQPLILSISGHNNLNRLSFGSIGGSNGTTTLDLEWQDVGFNLPMSMWTAGTPNIIMPFTLDVYAWDGVDISGWRLIGTRTVWCDGFDN